MKIYKDTITHYRRNQLDDHAACGDDLLGRRNEDQLDPFNTTCRNCLISTGRHHSTFQNLSNYFALREGWDLEILEDQGAPTPDSFLRLLFLGFKATPKSRPFYLKNVPVLFDHKWSIQEIGSMKLNSTFPKEEETI